MLFDLHSHFSFKPANSVNHKTRLGPDPDHWEERFINKTEFSKFVSDKDGDVVKTSQLNGRSARAGGFRVVCNSLYPLERGFIQGFLQGLGVLDKVLGTLTGHSVRTLKDLREEKVSYYAIMQREYDNMLANQGKPASGAGSNDYQLVKSYAELKKALKDSDAICIINSVEGMHSFASDMIKDGKSQNIMAAERRYIKKGRKDKLFEAYLAQLSANLAEVKEDWAHPPFFVTFSHHFYNHLAGHSPSIDGLVNFITRQRVSTLQYGGPGHPFKPLVVFYAGIHRWALPVVNQLLGRHSGQQRVRRVLVDVKHMSPQARLDYYAMVQLQQAAGDRIPIIMSHTGVSGRKDMQRSIDLDFELHPDEQERSKYFYDGVINLFDDEIKTIIGSDGLIGMMIDERRIMGVTRNINKSRGKALPPESGMDKKQFRNLTGYAQAKMSELNLCKHDLAWKGKSRTAIEKESKKIREELRSVADQLKRVYLSVLLRQIFHIVAVGGKEAWHHLTLGTDYDGVINPIDIYPRAEDMTDLRQDLIDHWQTQLAAPRAINQVYRKHLYGESPEYYVDKLLVLNGMNFLKKYYTDAYLRDGKLPDTGYVLSKAEEEMAKGD